MRFLVLLAALVAVAVANDSYVVVAPSKLRPGMDLNLSVNLLRGHSDVIATLKDDAGLTHASSQATFQQRTPGTLSLKVPEDLKSGSYKLHVQGKGGVTFQNETTLTFSSKAKSIFVQTDKAMYKPGQTVHFRAFAVYPDLKLYTGRMNVEIFDPNSNKIKQWLGVQDNSGVYTNYIPVSDQPVKGDWKIRVTAGSSSHEKVFTIAEYVLPKFEVTVELPSFALESASSIPVTVKAKYTYGKPVKGTVTLVSKVEVWYTPWNYMEGEQPIVQNQGTIDGEAKFTVSLAQLRAAIHSLGGRTVVVTANVTEELTGITLNGTAKVKVYDEATKVEFLESNPNTFKPGLPYTAYIKVSQQDGRPVPSSATRLTIEPTATYEDPVPSTTPIYYYPRTHTAKLSTISMAVPETGIVAVDIPIPDNATNMNFNIKYGWVTTYKSLSKSYSPSNSYIQLSLLSSQLTAGQTVNFHVKATQPVGDLVYQVLSRGSIVATGKVAGGNKQDVDFSLTTSSAMAPNARIVVYYVRQDGEIVTDSISFDVAGVFQNDVSISFDKQEAQPGDSVNVQVRADPQSLVNLLAVDMSVQLLKSGNDITSGDVIGELKTYDTIGHYNDFEPIPFGAIARRKRMIWWPYPTYYGGSDATQIFQNAGVKVLTDALVYKHVEKIYPRPIFMMRPMAENAFFRGDMMAAAMPMAGPSMMGASVQNKLDQPLAEVSRVRAVFPETWLWSNTTLGAGGTATISTTVPDTITSWIASAFAVNAQSGLGVADSTAKIRVFRPFFVSLNLPYSVVRGEQVALQAIVFNYLNKDTNVLVSLAQSQDFKNIVVDATGAQSFVNQDQSTTVMVKAGEAKTVFFPIVPSTLGNIDVTVSARATLAADAVKRTLLVEPEGVPKEYNVPVLIDLKDTNTFTKTVDITLPPNVVAGSQHARVTAIGDLMGPSVNGLDKLLQMPTGCGEQNMLGFAPDVFVSNYLKATGQLTSDIKDKALGFMEKGYQRELTYQHKDGSFSAFGDQDPSGSMWLTAFVVKSFHQAKTHIFIDDQVISRAVDWMLSKQAKDGSFPEPGRVIHKELQGGSASGPSLTAFALIALLENKDFPGSVQTRIQSAAASAQAFLESQLTSMTDTYTLAITTYALSLASSPQADAAFQMLNSKAVVKDGMKYWSAPDTKPQTTHSYWQPPNRGKAIEVEMTSYALLTYARRNDFVGGLSLMKFIVGQRNPNGGFISTQDTVLALQALSEFAKMAYSNNFNVQINVAAGSEQKQFTVNQQNALVLQNADLTSIPTQVTITATGSGIALVEVGIFFNVEAEVEQPSFELAVTLLEETLNALTVQMCTRWLQTGKSGMAVAEIGVPSGFDADLESIPSLPTLKRTETANKKVVLYFDEIGPTKICVPLRVQRTGLVAKTQPAAIRVYDYYEPDNQVTAFYQSQLLKNADINAVCPDC